MEKYNLIWSIMSILLFHREFASFTWVICFQIGGWS